MIPALVTTLLPVVGDLLKRWFPDPEQAAAAERELLTVLLSADLGQIEVNKSEAQHQSVFVAGWRPFIGWICGVGLFWAFVGYPLASWMVALSRPDLPIPKLSTDILLELVLAMLGLGGLRTFEKIKGAT